MITINMNKAKEIKKNFLRMEREEEFKKLDAAFMKAIELGDMQKQQDIAAAKQRLRDAPASELISNAQTPEELKAITIKDFL